MSPMSPPPVSLNCPRCGAPVHAQVYNLIDVGIDPALKGQLLRGRINAAHCAGCGSEGLIATPLMYHDPDKELLLVLIPPETRLNDQEQQQWIGQLTNLVMANLPAEKRKAYLLVPKVLLSYQGLLETILQKEGITPEMLAAQQSRMALLERLAQAQPDPEALRGLVAEVDEHLDQDFFLTLDAYIEANRHDGLAELVTALQELRQVLLEQSRYGREMAARILVDPQGRPALAREALLEKVLAASSEEELAELVAWHRSTLDYGFFQLLTGRMEQAAQAGQSEEAGRLGRLRDSLLAVTERLDQEAQASLEKASALLRQLLEAKDEEAEHLVRERLHEFDDAFFIVLGANLQAAEEAGRDDARERLQQLGAMVLQVAREKLPPHIRLLQELLATSDEAAVPAILDEHRALVDADLVGLLRELASESEADEPEVAVRLRRLCEQVEVWLQARS